MDLMKAGAHDWIETPTTNLSGFLMILKTHLDTHVAYFRQLTQFRHVHQGGDEMREQKNEAKQNVALDQICQYSHVGEKL